MPPRFFKLIVTCAFVSRILGLWNSWKSSSSILSSHVHNYHRVERTPTLLSEALKQNDPAAPRNITNDRREENSIGGIYIHVQGWGEGISSWRVSLAAVMVLAKQLDATIVEPFIKGGRLHSTGKLPLFELLDKSQIMSYHSKWTTVQALDQLKQQQSSSGDQIITVPWCISNFRSSTRHWCERNFTIDQATHPSALDMAVQEHKKGKTVILELSEVRRIYFVDLRLRQQPEIIREIVQVYRQFQFAENVLELADKFLASLNLTEQEFGVVHWRAETREGMDYDQCANYIVQTKNSLQSSVEKELPFVLMSSLSLDESKIWSSARHSDTFNSTSSYNALSHLINDHGFRMSDATMPEQKDDIIYAAVDLVLAQRASVFSTCTKSCNATAYEACMACNHLGMFAEMAMEQSWVRDPSAGYACWPLETNELEPVKELWPEPAYKVRLFDKDEPGGGFQRGMFDIAVLEE